MENGGEEGTHAADVCAEARLTETAEDEPELERAEAAPEREVPVAEVDDSPCQRVSVLYTMTRMLVHRDGPGEGEEQEQRTGTETEKGKKEEGETGAHPRRRASS